MNLRGAKARKGMEIAMSNTPFIANHPLIQHKVTLLRD